MIQRSAAIFAFFTLRVISALLLLKLSATFLPVGGFVLFSQFLALSSLLTLAAVGGIQNGLIRQAAIAGDEVAIGQTHSAGLTVWLAAIPLVGIPVIAMRAEISAVLAGTPEHGDIVTAILALTILAGPGQLWCSLLTGSGRTAASLGAQAAGILAGTGLAAWSIVEGNPAQAAIAFAAGPLLTAGAAFALARPLFAPARITRAAWSEIRKLLSYSAALAAVAGANGILLFGLRAVYRDAFDPVALGHWMAANRISDMATQLIGLFMLQAFVPRYSALGRPADKRRFVLRCGIAGTAVMLLPLAIFSLAAEPLVHIFLSDSYLPAIGMIRAYMAGDALRVWTSLAIFSAFASGRPGRYAAIEVGAMSLFGGATLALVGYGRPDAAPIAYLAAHAVAAAGVISVLMIPARRYRMAAVRADTA